MRLKQTCRASAATSDFGSNSEVGARNRHVRFPPDSDHTADIAGGPFRATFGLMQRSKISWLFDRFCNTVHTNRSPAHSTLRTGTKPQRAAMLVYRLRYWPPIDIQH